MLFKILLNCGLMIESKESLQNNYVLLNKKYEKKLIKCLDLLTFKRSLYETLCAIWYYLCNSQNMKSTHRRVLLLVKLQAE